MGRIRVAIGCAVLVMLMVPTASTAQAAPPTRDGVAPLRLPAALYDVIGVWELGWGDAPGRGRPAARAAVTAHTVAVGPNGLGRRVPVTTVGQPAQSQFMIGVDSVRYRRGSEWAEFAVADVTSLDEVRWPEGNQRSWVKVTWVAHGIEHTMHFQQVNASSQATLLATFRRALELNRERAGTPQG